MKNIKNNYLHNDTSTVKFQNKHKARTLSRSIAEEELTFKSGTALGSLSIAIEDGDTKRKVRRIIEKRVCKKYWKVRKNTSIIDNRHRAANKRYVSRVTMKIFGEPISGFYTMHLCKNYNFSPLLKSDRELNEVYC